MADSSIPVIRGFIAANVNGIDVADDEDIFAAGYVNSLFAVRLVVWIEETFGTTVTSEHLDIDNFRTITAIAAFVDGSQVPVASGEGEGGWTST